MHKIFSSFFCLLIISCSSAAAFQPSDQELLQQATAFFEGYKYKAANENFRRLVHTYPQSSHRSEALYYLGLIDRYRGNDAEAINHWGICVREKGSFADQALLKLGLLYGRQDKLWPAIDAFERLVKEFPRSELADDAQFYIGYYYQVNGYLSQAVTAYWKVIALFPNGDSGDEALWKTGRIYYVLGHTQWAHTAFSQAVSSYPSENMAEECLYWKAKCAEKLGQYTEALKDYQYLTVRYDHTYYAYRAREKLKAGGMTTVSLPEVIENSLTENNSLAPPSAGLAAEITRGQLYQQRGKYHLSITSVEDKIRRAIAEGAAATIPGEAWKLNYPLGYWELVKTYSARFGLDPLLVLAVIHQESHFNPRDLSHSLAHGLMQIIPSTGRGIAKDLKISPFWSGRMYEPELNIKMGTYYLALLLKRFGGDLSLAVAGYNGGPNFVARLWAKKNGADLDEFIENIPKRETREYVKIVLKNYWEYKRIYGS